MIKILPLLSRFAKGMALPILGTILNNKQHPVVRAVVDGEIRDVLDSSQPKEGRTDIAMLCGTVVTILVTVGAIYLLASGKISFEQLLQLIK